MIVIHHQVHGQPLHDIARFLGARVVVRKGGRLLDGRVFKNRQCPCEPDLYYEYEVIIPQGPKKRHVKRQAVVEFETNATTKSIETKRFQYEQSMTGVELQVIDLSEFSKEDQDNWRTLEALIAERIPP